MIKLRISDLDQIAVDIQATPPIVYLDHCVIGKLCKEENLGESVRDAILDKNGTLCWSWAHLLELFSLGLGNTFSKVKSFLTSFGTNIVPLELNPEHVYQNEKTWKLGSKAPQYDYHFIETMFGCWNELSPIDLGIILQVFENNPSSNNKWKKIHGEHKKEIQDLFLKIRDEYTENKNIINKFEYALSQCSPKPPHTEHIYNKLMIETITTHEAFNETDSIDFEHCVVSTAYTDFAVFDKKWTRRLRNIKLPQDTAKIFSIVELDQFLKELKQF